MEEINQNNKENMKQKKKEGRYITGDEKKLLLFRVLLEQGMTAEDCLVMLEIKDDEPFLSRYSLADKMKNLPALKRELEVQREKLGKAFADKKENEEK